MSTKIHDAIKRYISADCDEDNKKYYESAQLMKIPSFTLDKKAIDDFIFTYRSSYPGNRFDKNGKPLKVEGEYVSTRSPFEKTFYYFDTNPVLTTFVNLFHIWGISAPEIKGHEENKAEIKKEMEKRGLKNPLSVAWSAQEDTGILWDLDKPNRFSRFFNGDFIVFAVEHDFKNLTMRKESDKEGFLIEAYLCFHFHGDKTLYQVFDRAVILEYKKISDVIYKHHGTYMRQLGSTKLGDPLEVIWEVLERQKAIEDATGSTDYFFGKSRLNINQIELVLYYHWWVCEVTIKRTLEIFSCKNIIPDKMELPEKVVKQRQKKNKPEYSSYTLKIDPTQSPRNMNISLATDALWSNRLHTCRGHVREYGINGKGKLFGKYSGRFWSPPHQRGDRKEGIIDKDYDVQEA